MWLMYTGDSMTMGFAAFLPITVRMLTSASVSHGILASCAPRKRMSSNPGTGISVSMAPSTLLPERAIAWMSSMTPPSCLTRRGSTSCVRGASAEGVTSTTTGSSELITVVGASSPTRTNADLGERHSGHIQSSGRSSNLTPSLSSS